MLIEEIRPPPAGHAAHFGEVGCQPFHPPDNVGWADRIGKPRRNPFSLEALASGNFRRRLRKALTEEGTGFVGMSPDLNLDLREWGFQPPIRAHVHRQAGIRPGDGLSPAAHVSAVCPTISIELSANILPSRSVLVCMGGCCAVDLSRQPARYRSLSSRSCQQALSPWHPRPCGAQHVGGCQRKARLAHHDFANALIATARKLYADEDFGVDLANTVYALDTTTIDLSLSVFPWAHFRTAEAGIESPHPD